MSFYRSGLYVAVLLLVSCSGWNSELNTAYIEDDGKNLKPRCQFKTKQNCWTRSVDLLMDCVQPVNDPWVMVEGSKQCLNNTGDDVRSVLFKNPGVLTKDFSTNALQFTVSRGKDRCFRFTGTSSSFIIDQNDYGVLKVTTFDNGETQVSCFFGEKLVIPGEVKKQGCRGEKTKVSEFLPKSNLIVETKLTKSGEEVYDNFLFYFSGVESSQAPLFQCYL